MMKCMFILFMKIRGLNLHYVSSIWNKYQLPSGLEYVLNIILLYMLLIAVIFHTL